MKRKNPIKFLLLFSIATGLLSGCTNDQKASTEGDTYSLNAESETWRLDEYEITFTSEDFKAGNGTLNMKNQNEYLTKSFQFATHAIIDGQDFIVHSESFTADEPVTDIAIKELGTIETGAYLDQEGTPITIDQLDDMYMNVEWWDAGENKKRNETIELLDELHKESVPN